MINWSDKEKKLLEELEKTQKDFWNISRQTANFLNMLIKISGAKNVLEIGTSNGYSGIWLAKALRETGGKLTTVEYYEKRITLAKEHFKICGVDDIIEIKQGSATEVLEGLEDEFDFVFIDANKSEYIKYFELTHPKLKKGGIITADNITSHAEKVADFIKCIKTHPDYQSEILDLPGGLLIGQKLNSLIDKR